MKKCSSFHSKSSTLNWVGELRAPNQLPSMMNFIIFRCVSTHRNWRLATLHVWQFSHIHIWCEYLSGQSGQSGLSGLSDLDFLKLSAFCSASLDGFSVLFLWRKHVVLCIFGWLWKLLLWTLQVSVNFELWSLKYISRHKYMRGFNIQIWYLWFLMKPA